MTGSCCVLADRIFLTRPLSTVPGPTSTYVVTPSDARRGRRPPTARGPTPGGRAPRSPPLASRFGSASTLATTGTRGSSTPQRPQFRRQTLLGRLHQRAVERGADGQRHGALGAQSLGALAGPLHGSRRAGDHDLSWAVDVRRADHLTRGRLLAGPGHRLEIAAENRGHRAGANRHGLLHVASAAAHRAPRHRRNRSCPQRRWPSTRPGCARRRRRARCRAPRARGRRPCSPARIAGCVISVSMRRSLGALKHRLAQTSRVDWSPG